VVEQEVPITALKERLEAILYFHQLPQPAVAVAVLMVLWLEHLAVAVEVVAQEAEALLVLVAQHLHQDKVTLAG
jgi:hypothetical protein